MALDKIHPGMISLNDLNYLRKTATENNISSCGCESQAETTDTTTNVDMTSLSYNQTRARIRMTADTNSEIVGKHNENRKTLNALHHIKMLLKKTAKMLIHFGSEKFLLEKPGLLEHKIEKLITKLNRIAERANIDLADIEDPIPDEIMPPSTAPESAPTAPDENIPTVEEADLSAPIVGAGSLTPIEPEIVPEITEPSDVPITPPDEIILPDDTSIPEEPTPTVDEPTPDGLPVPTQDDLPALKDGLIFTIDSSLTRIVDIENNFLLEQYKLEGSLTYFGSLIKETETDGYDTQSITNIEFMLETTRMKMLSDSGKTIYAQTMNFSLDIVSLLN